MKKVVLFILLVSNLFAVKLDYTKDDVLGTAGDYTFVCVMDNNKVWAVGPDNINYKVIWFNPVINEDSWLECKDFDVYSNVYTQVE